MPPTPIHPAVPWLAYARWPAAFSFWALTFGSMSPDLEVHVARGLMHSLLGVVTVDALVTVLAVWLAAPPLVRWADRRWPGTDVLRFAGQDLRRDPRNLGTLYTSAAFGALTHVLVDLPTHANNPLFWPWGNSLTIVPFADQLWYDVVTTALWLGFFVIAVRAFWRR